MLIKMLQAKLHRVRVTRADLNYEGSCGIDSALLEKSGIREFQHLEIYNVENGERFTTYAIKSPRGSGEIRVRGTDRTAYTAPILIVHYVEAHGYRPPEEFIAAILNSG